MERVLLKCPTCGEVGASKLLDKGIIKCNICNSYYFFLDNDTHIKLIEAQTAIETYNFEKADNIYQNILNNTSNEKIKVMCYYGRLLSYFGIVHIKDFNNNLVVTFSNYDPKVASIKDSFYYKKISQSAYNIYEEQIEKLDKK